MDVPYQVKLVTSLDDPWLSSGDYASFLEAVGGIDAVFLSPTGMTILAPVYLRKDLTPFFVAVVEGTVVIALLPLILETKRLLPGIRLKRLHFWGRATECYSKHPCPRLLVREDHATQQVYTFLVEALLGELMPLWDCWYLMHSYEDESGLTGLRNAGLDVRPELSPYMAFEIWSQDLEEHGDLLSWLSGNARKLVRRGMRNAEQWTPPIRHVAAHEVSDELLQRVAEVHAARQNLMTSGGQDRINFFDDPVERAVVGDFLKFASLENALSVHMLQSDDALMAATFFVGKGREVFHYFYAWVPELQGTEGARLLWYLAIDDELKRGQRRRITHGMGETDTKRSFSSRRFKLVSGYALNTSPGSRLRYQLLLMLRALNDWIGKAIKQSKRPQTN